MTIASTGGTVTLGLYDTQSQLKEKASITYVDNKVDPLIGGHKGFATLALAQAAQGTLPSGSVVEVTNDSTESNNGLYLWNGADLTKSAYDPLTQAKLYTDNIDQKFSKELGLYTVRSNYCYTGTEGQSIAGSGTSTVSCVKMEVKAGDIFHIKTKGLNAARPYYLTNLSDVVVYVAAQNSTVTDFNVTVAEDGFLYVNCDNTVLSQLSIHKLSQETAENTSDINLLKNKIALSEGKLQLVEGRGYTLVSGKLTNVPQAIMSAASLDVTVGEEYFINSQGGAVYPPYSVVDSEGNTLLSNTSSAPVSASIVIPEGGARLLINCLNTYIDKFVFALLRKIDWRLLNSGTSLDSYFTDAVPYFTQTVIKDAQAQSATVSFSANPRLMNSKGQAAYLFPSGTTNFSLPAIPAYGILYIEDVPSESWVSTPYLPSGSIKTASFLSKLDISGKTILAINQRGDLLNYGAIGRKYHDDLTRAIPTINTRIGILESSPLAGLKSAYTSQPSYSGVLQEKCPNFYSKLKSKKQDVTVCITGTSLTQGNLYASTRADATTRPPLLHTKDLSSRVWDVLSNYWGGQKYRRYDHADLTYSASDWVVTNALPIWDDSGSAKNGLTKTTTSPDAFVSTIIPSDAWQFNFIYRTDSEGGACTVSINEGNSKVEVFNGSLWVEANGFTFTMLEPAKTATKGNTIYQKRLKMRCKNKDGGISSIGQTKQITITKANNSSRFNVVGFEWSPREFMLTMINAARGGHQWGVVGGAVNLETLQDSDIWPFEPDLILMETTVINWGGSSVEAVSKDPLFFKNSAKRAYFNEFSDNPDSIYETSDHYTKCDIVFYGDTMSAAAAYNSIWDSVTKEPKFELVTTAATNGDGSTENIGMLKSNFENYEIVDEYMSSKNYIFIPATFAFKQVAEKYFGSYWSGFQGSGKDGITFASDGTHLNDNGAAFWTYLITPLFENL